MSYQDKISKYQKLTADIFSKCNCDECHEMMKAARYAIESHHYVIQLGDVLEKILNLYLQFYSHCGFKIGVQDHFVAIMEALLLKGMDSCLEDKYLDPGNLPFRKYMRKTLKKLSKIVNDELKFYEIMTDLANNVESHDLNSWPSENYYSKTLKKVQKHVKREKKRTEKEAKEQTKQRYEEAHVKIVNGLRDRHETAVLQLISVTEERNKLQDELSCQNGIPQALNRKIEGLRNTVDQLNQQLDTERHTVTELTTQLQQCRKQLTEMTNDHDFLRQQLAISDRTIKAMNAMNNGNDISDIEATILKLEADKNNLRSMNAALEHENARAKSDLQLLRSTCQTLRDETIKLKEVVDMRNQECRDFHRQIENLEGNKSMLIENIRTLQEEKVILNRRVKGMTAEIDRNGDYITELEGGAVVLTNDIQTSQAEIKRLNQTVLDLESRLSALQCEIRDLNNDLTLREDYTDRDTATIRRLENEISELKKAKLEVEKQAAEKSDIMTAKGKLEDRLRAILNLNEDKQ